MTLSERLTRLWRDTLKPLALVVILLTSFRSAVADWNDVPSGSMRPTILDGDRVFLNKLAYDLRFPFFGWRILHLDDPQRGDIVIFPSPVDGVRLIKRIVAVPGDHVTVTADRVTINGHALDYAPLDPSLTRGLSDGELTSHRFLEEDLEGRPHAVMMRRLGGIGGNVENVVLGKGQYFMMGDNRDNSRDSRFFGPVDRDAIQGKALAVAVSVDPDAHYMPRFWRFFHGLR